MSYKKFEDIQYLYESINDQHEEIEECLDLIENQLRSEGYSDTAIHSFMETADEFALQEKVMLLDEGIRKKALELLTKYGPRLQNLGRRIRTGVKRNTPVKVRKTVKSTVQNAQDTTNKITTKGKEVLEKGKEVVKNNPKTSAVVGVSGLTAGAIATSGDGEGQGQGNQSISGNQNRGGGKDDSNNETSTPAKPGHFKDAQGKEFPTTDTIRGITRKELSTERTPIKNRRGRTTGYTKSEQDIENEKIDKQVDKYVADRKVPINKDLTIDKSEEGKAKYAEKAAERAAKEAEKEVNTPKPVKMSNLEKKNRARFGDAAIDKLKQKQIDFKKMQANSQLPGADRGAEKEKFITKYPNSITAQKAAGLRDHYDPFDIVLGYLVESEQVDSMDEALYIMMEMDAATIQGIVRDFEILTEEEADRMKDERLEKYGIGHDGSDRKAGSGGRSDSKKPKGKTVLQKETEKKHGKGKSPLEVAKANIISKYGKGAIAPSKKKKK